MSSTVTSTTGVSGTSLPLNEQTSKKRSRGDLAGRTTNVENVENVIDLTSDKSAKVAKCSLSKSDSEEEEPPFSDKLADLKTSVKVLSQPILSDMKMPAQETETSNSSSILPKETCPFRLASIDSLMYNTLTPPELSGPELLAVNLTSSVPIAQMTSALEASLPVHTSLVEHVSYFANSDGIVTWHSMLDTFTNKLHMNYLEALGVATALAAILGSRVTGGLPFRPFNASQAPELIHPCDSRTYNPDGSINQTSLNAILNYAQPGKDFLSAIDITTMVNDFRERDSEKSSILDRNATDGEFKLLLRLCCDHWEEIDGKYVPCLTKETISLFYTDHNKLFNRVERGELPIAMPVA